MNDRLLRITAVLSLFALLGGAAAVGGVAAQDFEVEEVDTTPVAPFDDDIDVEVTILNNGSLSGAADVTFAANETSPIGPGSTVTGPSYTTPSLAPGDTNTTTLTLNTDANYNTGTPNLTSIDAVDKLQHGVFVNESGSSVVDDTASRALTVGTDSQEGSIRTVISDTDGFPVEDAEVSLYVGSVDPSNLVARSIADQGPDSNSLRFGNNPTRAATDVPLAIGPDTNDPVEYVAQAEKSGFEADNSSAELHENNEFERIDLELRPLVTPDEINVIQENPTRPSDEIARADGIDQINFNITVFGSEPGEPAGSQVVDNSEVLLDVDAPAEPNVTVTNRDTSTSFTGDQLNGDETDAPLPFQTGNGQLNLSVTSDRVQDVFFTFTTVKETENITISGNGPTGLAIENPRRKSFFLDGEGTVIGDVWDTSTPDLRSLEDARIWTFRKETVSAQSIRVPPISTNGFGQPSPVGGFEGFDSEGDQAFFRLVRTEDPTTDTPSNDTVLDVTQDYRIDNDGQNENLSISRVRELDLNDSTVGSGWAVRANTDNPCSSNVTGTCLGTGMYVTPLEPGNYYVESANNQINASDQRFVDTGQNSVDDNTFFQYNISGTSQFADNRNVTPNLPTQRLVERSGNLTYEAAQEFSTFSGQQRTDLTDENGEYVLDDLYTDFQAGIDYTIFANKGGYEIEFVDGFVTESGAFFEDGTDENFAMRPIEEDVEVNVTNVALLDNVGDAGGIADPTDPDAYEDFAFDNQTDRFSQVVPRDGSSIDVLEVETQTVSGAPVNETIELSVPAPELPGTEPSSSTNFTGEFIQVAGGTIVDEDTDAPTITINTGSDGQAIVWLQTDLENDDLTSVFADNFNTGGQVCSLVPQFEEGDIVGFNELFSGVVAQSPNDAGVVDATCKDFRGTVVLKTAELSGIVTDQNNNPVESRVWTRDIDLEASPPVTNPTPGFIYTNHRIEVERTGNDSYTVEHLLDNVSTTGVFQNERTLGIETGVTFDELSQDGGDAGYTGFDSANFPQIAVAGLGTGGFSLATDSDDVDDPATEDSSYTLPEVPAEDPDSPDTGIAPKGIDRANFSFTGQAVETGVQINRTSTANIEIKLPFEEAQFNVLDVDAPASVSQGDTYVANATIRNDGAATRTGDVFYDLVNESGTVVESKTGDITLSGGEEGFVEFSVDTTGRAAENYTNNVTTTDDTAGESAPTEVVADLAPAFFEVSNVDAPDTEKPENATITADIENTGEAEGTQDISFLLEGEDTTVGGGALDVVFTFDTTSSMFEEIDGAQDSITAFTDEVDASGADARYGLVEFKNDDDSVAIRQDLTSDASAVKSAIDGLSASGGGVAEEASYDAIRSAVQDTDRRSSARLVVIHITDAPSHYAGDGTGATTLTRSDAASDLNGANARFVCACPAGEDLFGPDSEANVTDMAINDVDDSLFVRLASGDFGDTLTDEIATAVTEAAGGLELNLDGGESDTVSFEVPTENLSTGLYDVTVNSEDDSGSTTTNITSSTFESPIDGVSDDLWTAVTSQDDTEDDLSLSDVGAAINAYQSNPGDAEIDGVSISLGDLGSIISYYQDVVAA